MHEDKFARIANLWGSNHVSEADLYTQKPYVTTKIQKRTTDTHVETCFHLHKRGVIIWQTFVAFLNLLDPKGTLVASKTLWQETMR